MLPDHPIITSEEGSDETKQLIGLQQQIARLEALLESSRQIHGTIHLNDVLSAILTIAVRELELLGAGYTSYDVAYGEPLPADLCAAGVHHFIIQSKSGEPLTDLLVYAGAHRILTLEDTDFLEHLAVQAGVAIENAVYHERAIQWERVQRDLSAAREIQLSLVPHVMPKIAGYTIAVRFNPCYEVGGDYLDILPYGDDQHLLVLADVAGKGLASALIGNAFRSALRAMAATRVPIDEMATRLNDLQYGEGPEARRRYLTAAFLLLHPSRHTISVVNAGHVPVLLIPGDGAESTVISSSGPPIGILPWVPGMEYKLETHSFPPGARLLLCTDGITETAYEEQEFTLQGVEFSLRNAPGTDCDGLLDSLWRDVLAFARGNPQEDDMTALALIRQS
jgi:serine phosphatase RsbU (regulator of sigma subunit)